MISMKKGSRGEYVRLLQLSLGGLNPDGIFGPKTEDAVKEFQSNNNLLVDGIAGKATYKKLGILEKVEEIQAAGNVIIDCPNIKQQAVPHGPKIYGPNKDYSTYASAYTTNKRGEKYACMVIMCKLICFAWNIYWIRLLYLQTS